MNRLGDLWFSFRNGGAGRTRETAPGGVLKYMSDGDVRSPFLGLKFAI